MKKNYLLLMAILLTGCQRNENISPSDSSISTSSSSVVSTSSSTSSVNTSTSTSSSTNSSTSTSSTSKEELFTSNLPLFDVNKKITIDFWHTMDRDTMQPFLDRAIADFNNTYYGKNITINHEKVGGYDEVRDAVITNISVGATPHLAFCLPDHVALYRDSRAVVELDDYIKDVNIGLSLEERYDFVNSFYNEGRTFIDEKMYSLPFLRSSEVLFYDKTFFNNNNINVPTTWDEMWDVCAKIKKLDSKSIPLGYESESNWFITNAEQRGFEYTSDDTKIQGVDVGVQGYFRFDNIENEEFLSELKTNFDKGYFTTREVYGESLDNLFNNSSSNSRSYMSIVSTDDASNYYRRDTEVGVGMVPQAEGDKKIKDAVYSSGPSICMFQKDNIQEQIATWLFLKYLTTNLETQVSFSTNSKCLPVLNSALNSQGYNGFLERKNYPSEAGLSSLSLYVAKEQALKEMYYNIPSFVGSVYAYQAVGSAVVDVLIKESTPEEALKDAIEYCVIRIS